MKTFQAAFAILPVLALLVEHTIAQGPPPDTARTTAIIAKFDRNGDGKLTEEEMRAAQPGMPAGAADTHASSPPAARGTQDDRALKNAEFIQRLLDKFDTDGDGSLNYAEMDGCRRFLRDNQTAGGKTATGK